MTLQKLLDDTAFRFPGKDAVVQGRTRLTFGDLLERAGRVTSRLAADYAPGSRVAVIASNIPEFVELYFGLAASGLVAVPVNFRLTASEIAYILQDADVSAVIFTANLEPQLTEALGDSDLSPDLVRIGDPARDSILLPAQAYNDWLASAALEFPGPDGRDAFLIAYTSGTTGRPKGALISQNGLIEAVRLQQNHYGGLNAHDRLLTVMPLFHINAAMFAVACVAAGATNIVQPSGDGTGHNIICTVKQHGITILSVVPTILREMLAAVREDDRVRPTTLRALLCGSAPLDYADKQAVHEVLGAELYEIYGATELSIVTVLQPKDVLERPGSVGRVVPGKELQLRDGGGNVTTEGEIWSRGQGTLLVEYWNRPEATREARDDDGWVSVGDLARVDEEGYVYLLDRKNDLIISGGENVYPQEVEAALQHYPGVESVAVVAAPDEKWGERVHAVLVMAPDCIAPTVDELRAFTADTLARYKQPRSVEVWPRLPQTATGKIQRRKVRDRLHQS